MAMRLPPGPRTPVPPRGSHQLRNEGPELPRETHCRSLQLASRPERRPQGLFPSPRSPRLRSSGPPRAGTPVSFRPFLPLPNTAPTDALPEPFPGSRDEVPWRVGVSPSPLQGASPVRAPAAGIELPLCASCLSREVHRPAAAASGVWTASPAGAASPGSSWSSVPGSPTPSDLPGAASSNPAVALAAVGRQRPNPLTPPKFFRSESCTE